MGAEWVYHSLSSQNVEDFIKEMGGVVSSAKAVHKTLQGKLRLILFIIILGTVQGAHGVFYHIKAQFLVQNEL